MGMFASYLLGSFWLAVLTMMALIAMVQHFLLFYILNGRTSLLMGVDLLLMIGRGLLSQRLRRAL